MSRTPGVAVDKVRALQAIRRQQHLPGTGLLDQLRSRPLNVKPCRPSDQQGDPNVVRPCSVLQDDHATCDDGLVKKLRNAYAAEDAATR
jgi:hypothetical protein